MEKGNLLIILALFSVLGSSQMSFRLSGATYQVSGGYYSLNIPVSGGVPPLTYTFQAYPATWTQTGNRISIPTAQTNPGGMWAVKVIVTDALGNKLQRSLVIKVSNGGDPLIGDYAYEQTFSFNSNGQIVSLPVSTAIVTSSTSSTSSTTSSQTSQSTSLGSSSNNGASFGSASSTTGVISLQTSGTGVNTELPTNSQLDTLINSADVVAIRQTIQKVIASTLTCTAKMQYLSDFLGRIETYIAIKRNQIQQFSNIFDSSSTQINSLRAQIANYTRSISNLNITQLRSQLDGALDQLQLAYNEFNGANIDLTPFNLNITANIQSIKNLTNQLELTKTTLKSDQQALEDTDTLIASLEKQLADARNNKAMLEGRILVGTTNSSNLKGRIDLLNANNVALNNEINRINSQKITLQANYQALQTRAEGIRNTINARSSLKQKYESQIDTLNKQIGDLTGNLDTAPLAKLNQTVIHLENSVPSLQEQIDYVRFNCLGIVNYTVQTLDGVITYTFGSSVFSTYVTRQYGLDNANRAQSLLGPISRVTLTPITVFDSTWSDAFGQAFSTDLQVAAVNSQSALSSVGNGLTQSYFLDSDFQCSTQTSATSGSGVVKSIEDNVVIARTDDGKEVKIILGACTNVFVSYSGVPQLGRNVFWNGFQISADTFQAYSTLFV